MAILKKDKQRVVAPVCGMTISRKDSALISSYQGRDYYFCSERCKSIFEENPGAVFEMKADREELTAEMRTESLDKMAEELAHEIRNPVTSIGGFARRVHEMLPDKGRSGKYLEIVIENAARLENMITKVVELKTPGVFRAELSDFSEIIIEPVDLFKKERNMPIIGSLS